MCFTTPDTFDLMEISFSGSIVPTASALSTILPFWTFTFGRRLSDELLDPPRRKKAPAAMTMRAAEEMRSFFFMAVCSWLAETRYLRGEVAVGGTMEGSECCVGGYKHCHPERYLVILSAI